MPRVTQLSIVIPAYDEEGAIASVVAENAVFAASLVERFELVVCDDGSRDGTWTALERLARSMPELRLLRHEANRGIPATMKDLYDAARGQWTYFTPGDGQVPPDALGLMWAAREGVSAVVGRRFPRRDRKVRGLMAGAYATLVRSLFGLDVRDVDGVKLYRTADVRRARPRSTSVFFEAELLVRLTRGASGVREVNVPHRPRTSGRAKGVTLPSTARALRDVAAFALLPAWAAPAQEPAVSKVVGTNS